MKPNREKILTTHVGSLPRPEGLLTHLVSRQKGEVAAADLHAEVARAIEQIVADQVAAGIDIVSDGEMSKFSYSLYVADRIQGIVPGKAAVGRNYKSMAGRDVLEHPDFMARFLKDMEASFEGISFPVCVGPLAYSNLKPLESDLDCLAMAAAKSKPAQAFMTAASPGTLVRFVANTYYPSEDAYLQALAEVMKIEYAAIAKRDVLLQIDCPDLASSRNTVYKDKTEAEFLAIAERNVEALNYATEGIAPDAMRIHICWGNYEGPHTNDIPLSKIMSTCLRARAAGISFEGANPRHEHEWEDLAGMQIPDDKILIPGVIDSTSNFVEHPRLIAQRICRYVDIVGRDRVVAGADCGFGTFATVLPVAPSIVWSKLRALSEGAGIATQRLWQ